MRKTILAIALIAAGTAACAAPKPVTPKMNKPYICAHRGASSGAPENTLAAFKLAVELGADAVELDTQLSKDGVPVILHDGAVDRTTNGHGKVRDLTLAEIKQLDAGSWKSPAFKGEPLPTLESLFRMPRCPFLNVEIKIGNADDDVVKLVDTVVALIQRYHLQKKLIVSSFSGQALERVHARDPKIATGYLYGGKTPEKLPVGITALHPMYTEVTPEFMAFAKGKGLQVNVWTVDSAEEMRRLIALGVGSIITNVPAQMKDVLSGKAR